MAVGVGKRKGKGGGEEQGSATTLECAGIDAAAHVYPEGLGHRGEHPAKSGSCTTSEPQAPQRGTPNWEYNAYASTAPALHF